MYRNSARGVNDRDRVINQLDVVLFTWKRPRLSKQSWYSFKIVDFLSGLYYRRVQDQGSGFHFINICGDDS